MRRALREEFYRAFITRASSGENDNTPLIERTLALKREQAQLLGYPNYAEVSLASKVHISQLRPFSIQVSTSGPWNPDGSGAIKCRTDRVPEGCAEAQKNILHGRPSAWVERTYGYDMLSTS